MSDLPLSDDEIDQDDNPGDFRRRLEDQTRKAREAAATAEARAAAAERELAFAKAGLPLSDPKMGYFVKGYEGDLTPEAIRAAAEEAGFLSTDTGPASVPAQELAEHQQVANLAASGTQDAPWSGDIAGNPQYQQEMAQVRSPEEALAVMARYGSPILIDE